MRKREWIINNEYFKNLYTSSKLTKREFCKKLNISISDLNNLLNNPCFYNFDVFLQFSRFKISFDDFFTKKFQKYLLKIPYGELYNKMLHDYLKKQEKNYKKFIQPNAQK